MTIASPNSVLPEDKFVGWTGVGNRFREFARIRHQQRTHDSFRNHPYGKPILLCLVQNAGMHEIGKARTAKSGRDLIHYYS